MFHALRKTPNKDKEGFILISKFSTNKVTQKAEKIVQKGSYY